jgi:hypothetical protein
LHTTVRDCRAALLKQLPFVRSLLLDRTGKEDDVPAEPGRVSVQIDVALEEVGTVRIHVGKCSTQNLARDRFCGVLASSPSRISLARCMRGAAPRANDTKQIAHATHALATINQVLMLIAPRDAD